MPRRFWWLFTTPPYPGLTFNSSNTVLTIIYPELFPKCVRNKSINNMRVKRSVYTSTIQPQALHLSECLFVCLKCKIVKKPNLL